MEPEGFFIHVDSRPKPKERPRMSRRRTYTPETTIMAEQCVRDAWHRSGHPMLEVPVDVTIIYDRNGSSIWVKEIDNPTTHWGGDLDNLVKLTLDGLQQGAVSDGSIGGAFTNDKLVRSCLLYTSPSPRD